MLTLLPHVARMYIKKVTDMQLNYWLKQIVNKSYRKEYRKKSSIFNMRTSY